MVAAIASSKAMSLEEVTTLYDSIKEIIHASGPDSLGISLPDVNALLLNEVSANILTSSDAMKTELKAAFEIVKDLESDVNTAPTDAAREVASMSAMVNVETTFTIPSRVKMLLANFQNAVEDPVSLYPRLICCDMPVDPAKVVNFAKRYRLLDQMLQADAVGDYADRSMPSAPKSAVDVITNVNSSVESASDFLCEAVNDVEGLSESVEAMRVAAESLSGISKPVNEAMNKLEEIRRVFDRISFMLSQGDEANSTGNHDNEDNQDALQVMKNVSSLIENLTSTRFHEDLVLRLQNAKGMLSDFVKNLTALLSRAKKAFSNLISTLRKFVNSLPRIAQELRQFFVPTGFRALIMKPSPDLMSLLQSIDDLRTVLPEPDNMKKSASDAFGSKGPPNRIAILLDKFDQFDMAQRKLFASIKNQNLPVIISETVQETLETVLRDLRSSVSGILNLTGENVNGNGVAGKLKKLIAFGSQRRSENKPGREGQRSPGLVENVTGAGGLFGRIFEP